MESLQHLGGILGFVHRPRIYTAGWRTVTPEATLHPPHHRAGDAPGPRACHSPSTMARWGRIATAYLLLGAFSFAAALYWRGVSPFVYAQPWLALPLRSAHAYSLLLGLGLGGLLVMGTRYTVERYQWARDLHAALRPFARSMSTPTILALAVLSGLGEELLFRGLLTPWLGVLPQAVIFGVAHQLPGPSRWVWVGWATAVGLLLGSLFVLTGSLAGPIAAHVLVNGINLSYLRAHDPGRRRELGGLLGHPSDG